MRRVWLGFCLLFLVLNNVLLAQNIPQATGRVNDFAGVITPEYKEKLDSLIEEIEEKTSAEIAIVSVDSIAPYDEKEYARLLFDNWKPGKKGKDNGVLVLVAIKERRWRIETGYGIEGILPDGLCGEIGRNYMAPYFKEAKYAEGLYRGVEQVYRVLAKDINVSPGASVEYLPVLFFFVFIIFLGIIALLNLKEQSGTYYGKGSSGGYYGGGNFGGGFSGGGFGGGGFGGGLGGGGGAGGRF